MQFRILDADGNARLGRDDLEASAGKSLADLQRAARHRMKAPGFGQKQLTASMSHITGISVERETNTGK